MSIPDRSLANRQRHAERMISLLSTKDFLPFHGYTALRVQERRVHQSLTSFPSILGLSFEAVVATSTLFVMITNSSSNVSSGCAVATASWTL